MTDSVDRSRGTVSDDERARNRYAARRVDAAARADVSLTESQTLSRAAAEALVTRRRERLASARYGAAI